MPPPPLDPRTDALAQAPPGLVAFDFDGTLTVRDSFSAFLRWRVSAPAAIRAAPRLAFAALRYLKDRDRGRLKGETIDALLGGEPRERLAEDAEAFAARAWRSTMRPDALARWAMHRARGDRLIIVTASPEILVRPFATRLRADGLIGSRLSFDAGGRLAGGLDGPNCRGMEKLKRLAETFPAASILAAYGDTLGDREMLAAAAHPFYRLFTAHPNRLRPGDRSTCIAADR